MNKNINLSNMSLEDEHQYKTAISEIKEPGKFNRNIVNPIETGLIKAHLMIADILAHPNFEELGEKYNNDPNKIYEAYKKELKENNWKNSEIRKKGIEQIKSNREIRNKYLDPNNKIDKGIMIAHSFLEGMANPINWINSSSFLVNLGFNLVQGAYETFWEKQELEGKKLEDFTTEDTADFLVGAGTTVALHGTTKAISKYLKPQVAKTTAKIKEKVNNKISELAPNVSTPLDVLENEVKKYGAGATSPKAVIELAERIETGETVSLPRYKNFSKETEEFFIETTEKRLNQLNKKNNAEINLKKNENTSKSFEDDLIKKMKEASGNKNISTPQISNDKDLAFADSVSKVLKPIKNKIKLNAKQVQAEYTKDLMFIHMENGGNGNFNKLGDLNAIIVNDLDINGKTFKDIIRGNHINNEKLIPYANEYRRVANEYVNLKYNNNLSESKFNFDIVYDKNTIMHNLRNIMKSGDELKVSVFNKEYLKRTNNKVYLSNYEANTIYKVGEKAGFYELSDNQIIDKLHNNINGTTKDMQRMGNGKVVDYESKTWLEVATENSPFPEAEEYFRIKKLIKNFKYEEKQKFLSSDKVQKFDKSKYLKYLKSDNIVHLSKNEANTVYKVGKKEGFYELSDNQIIDKLLKNLKDEEKQKFLSSNLLSSDKVQKFMKNYEENSMYWLDSIFDSMNAEGDVTNRINYLYKNVIDEKSGFSIVNDRLKNNFSDVYKLENTNNEKTNKFINSKTFKDTMIDELENFQEISAKLSTRKYSDMSFSGKSIYNIRNTMMYKYLSTLNYIKETASNKARINAGAIDLGFSERVGIFQSGKEMARATKNVFKNIEKIKNQDLSLITNPMERLQAEVILDRYSEMLIDMNGANKFFKISKNAGELGAKGQFASDVQRVALAEWYTLNAMFNDFTKMNIDNVTPTMKQVLFDMGITDNIKLKNIQDDILSHKNIINFMDEMKNINNTSTTKNLFSQFSDIMGKELNVFDSESLRISANTAVGKFWFSQNSMFRMYSINTLGRIMNKITTYIDSDGFTRYRFLKDGQLSINQKSFTGLKDWKNASRIYNSGTTALEIAGLVYGIRWITGKLTGTSSDELVEAKIEALMHGEIGDIALDTITSGFVDTIGLDIAMGGGNPLASYVKQSIGGIKRSMSADKLNPVEKIYFASMYLISPNAIARGIDNIKFDRNIPNRIDTTSRYTQNLWSRKYKKEAEYEQRKGKLPIEKALSMIGNSTIELAKSGFNEILNKKTDYQKYFEKYPEQAERFGEFKENTPVEAKIALASGIMEMQEYSVRSEKLDEILSVSETIEERERELKTYGMDINSLIKNIDKEKRLNLHSILSFSDIREPETIILLLNELDYIKNPDARKSFILNFVPKDRINEFKEFHNKVKTNKAKVNELIREKYDGTTEGYIEFLQALRNEI